MEPCANEVFEANVSANSTRSSRASELLEIILENPKINHEIKSIFLDFQKKYEECTSENKYFCEFEVMCMYTINYIYQHEDPTILAIARSVYCYLRERNRCSVIRNLVMKCNENCENLAAFMSGLREFKNFRSTEGEEILIDAMFYGLICGNLGLSRFLVKFNLINFPFEDSLRARKIATKFVIWFNGAHGKNDAHDIPEDQGIFIQFDEFYTRMQHNEEIGFRRSLFILVAICIIADYGESDKAETTYQENPLTKHTKYQCYRKLMCLDLFIKISGETFITFKDISKFLEICLGMLKEEFRIFLMETSRNIFSDVHELYNPRSLKHLARSKIRENLNSPILPKDISRLQIPADLQKFINEEKNIWKALKDTQKILYLNEEIDHALRL